MRIVFLNPASDADPFYRKMVQFGRLAADELGVELEVLEAGRSLDRMRQLADGLVQADDRPDYLLLVNDRNLAAELLPSLTEAGIKAFLITEGFFVSESQLLGRPRQTYPNWLGGLLPDDEQAGRLAAEALAEAARAAGLRADDGRIHILGLSGAYSIGAILRMNGLRGVVDHADDLVLDEVAPALWEQETAREMTPELLERNPRATVIWAASDQMALGAVEALEANGRRPGTEILVGGIDWSPFVFDRVGDGVVTASVGGHFLDLAWSIIVLFDHHRGIDFEPRMARSRFSLMTHRDRERYKPFFDESYWPEFRFAGFSRALDPERGEVRFGVDALLGSAES